MGRGHAGKGAQKTTPREATTPKRRPKATERAVAPSLPSESGADVGADVGTRQDNIIEPEPELVHTPSRPGGLTSRTVVQVESSYSGNQPADGPRRAGKSYPFHSSRRASRAVNAVGGARGNRTHHPPRHRRAHVVSARRSRRSATPSRRSRTRARTPPTPRSTPARRRAARRRWLKERSSSRRRPELSPAPKTPENTLPDAPAARLPPQRRDHLLREAPAAHGLNRPH